MENGANPVDTLNRLLSEAGLHPVHDALAVQFAEYLTLILRWNGRMNLTAVREPHVILSRHFVESIACAERLPPGIASLLDFGSGAGFPGIAIALCRPEISVTLADSQSKKAAFLHEAARSLKLSCKIWAGRAEKLAQKFDCVTLRAVDQMESALAAASSLVRSGGVLAVLTSASQLSRVEAAAGRPFQWESPTQIHGSEQRVIYLGRKAVSD